MDGLNLKSCPFCGGKSFIVEVTKCWLLDDEHSSRDALYDAKVACYKCGAEMRNARHHTPDDALKAVIQDWNMRTNN